MSAESTNSLNIWIDADACPVAIKDLVYRAAKRLEVNVTVVANQSIGIPKSPWVRQITVRSGADQADHAIVSAMQSGDIVVADDIPLAARVVEKNGFVINSRGELLDENNIAGRLASRNFMEQLRSAGMDTGGPKPLSQKDTTEFANQLDRLLTKRLRKQR